MKMMKVDEKERIMKLMEAKMKKMKEDKIKLGI
jgi:hypothetical protein